MISQIPHPIQRTLLKTILLGAAVLSFGAIWGIVSQDKVFLILSAAVGILGRGKKLSPSIIRSRPAGMRHWKGSSYLTGQFRFGTGTCSHWRGLIRKSVK